MRKWFLLAGVLVSGFGLGCLWDRDTVAMELKGMPEIQNVIAGRFERNPDLFYEMRIERITQAGSAMKIEEYFDVAVAFDRLGKHDEAIGWIDEFDEIVSKVKMGDAELKDLSYKRNANLGTFFVHRGLKKGDDGMGDLKKGLSLLERSVEINPQAHFGREKVQIALVQDRIMEIESGFGLTETDLTREEIREGVIGMMVLGNAWESARVWSWLLGAIDREDGNVADLIVRRINEIDSKFDRYELQLPEPLDGPHLEPEAGKSKGKEVYGILRMNGDQWSKRREEFLVAGLQSGRHPDTDVDFWEGYEEVPAAVIEDSVVERWVWWWSNPQNVFFAGFGGSVMGVTGLYFWLKRRKRVLVGR